MAETGQGDGATGSDDAARQDQDSGPAVVTPVEDRERAVGDPVAEENQGEREGQEQREIRDLDAQEDMAFWAKWMFWATAATVVVTAAGLVLIGFTLHYTRKATDHTRSMLDEARKTTAAAQAAVHEAEKATLAAQDTVAVTRDLGEIQARAYMVLQPSHTWVRHPDLPGETSLDLTLTGLNRGQTPAMIKRVLACSGPVAAGDTSIDPRHNLALAPVPEMQCGPGVSIPIHNLRVVRTWLEELIRNRAAVLVHVRVEYLDAFKKDRFVSVSFRHLILEIPPTDHENRLMGAVQTTSYPIGNDSN